MMNTMISYCLNDDDNNQDNIVSNMNSFFSANSGDNTYNYDYNNVILDDIVIGKIKTCLDGASNSNKTIKYFDITVNYICNKTIGLFSQNANYLDKNKSDENKCNVMKLLVYLLHICEENDSTNSNSSTINEYETEVINIFNAINGHLILNKNWHVALGGMYHCLAALKCVSLLRDWNNTRLYGIQMIGNLLKLSKLDVFNECMNYILNYIWFGF